MGTSEKAKVDPTALSAAELPILRLRATLLGKLRAFFDAHGFVEVQTPVLSQDVVIDRHLDPLTVPVESGDARHPSFPHRFLQTSPEQNMKRLLASGMKAIYQVGPVFRKGERGKLHNPEFTMAEWYRVGDDYEQGMQLLETLVQELLTVEKPMRDTYQHAFLREVGIDPWTATANDLAEESVHRGLVEQKSWSVEKDDWLDLLFSHVVQPRLGRERPVTLTHFPATQAALARLSPDDAKAAERFELFVQGVELANGFHELLDAEVLRERDREANRGRRVDGKTALPEANRLLDAMEMGIPPCAGCALGFDRLVMLAAGKDELDAVLCFPWERA